MMFELVLWSFAIALTPVALRLMWGLISGVGGMIGSSLWRAVEVAEQPGPSCSVAPHPSVAFRLEGSYGPDPQTGKSARYATGAKAPVRGIHPVNGTLMMTHDRRS